jgi:hypothetical protein
LILLRCKTLIQHFRDLIGDENKYGHSDHALQPVAYLISNTRVFGLVLGILNRYDHIVSTLIWYPLPWSLVNVSLKSIMCNNSSVEGIEERMEALNKEDDESIDAEEVGKEPAEQPGAGAPRMKDDDDEPSASQLLTAGPSPRWAHTY